MENMRDLTSLRFVTDGDQFQDFGSLSSGAMGSDNAMMNPLAPISPCVAADNPISQNIGIQAGNVANFQDQLKEVLREKHEKYLLMNSNKCEKSVGSAVDYCEKAADNASEKSNVIPSGSNIITSREFNNANIVTESILIEHPKGKQKTKRVNKRRRRKAIATEVNANMKKRNVSDPQMTNDKICSSSQATDDKATDSRGKAKTTTNKENDIMQQQQSVPHSNLKSFTTPLTSDEISANPCDAEENPPGNSSNSNNDNNTDNANKMKLGGKGPKRSAVILGDSIVKNIHSWKLKEKCGHNENVYVKCFNGANIRNMHSYAKPYVVILPNPMSSNERKPNVVILHIGTNDLSPKRNEEDKSAVQIAQEVIELAKGIRENDIEVIISDLVSRGDEYETKRKRVNLILADLCSENNYAFIEHASIVASKHLNKSLIHLNKASDNLLEGNIVRALCY